MIYKFNKIYFKIGFEFYKYLLNILIKKIFKKNVYKI